MPMPRLQTGFALLCALVPLSAAAEEPAATTPRTGWSLHIHREWLSTRLKPESGAPVRESATDAWSVAALYGGTSTDTVGIAVNAGFQIVYIPHANTNEMLIGGRLQLGLGYRPTPGIRLYGMAGGTMGLGDLGGAELNAEDGTSREGDWYRGDVLLRSELSLGPAGNLGAELGYAWSVARYEGVDADGTRDANMSHQGPFAGLSLTIGF